MKINYPSVYEIGYRTFQVNEFGMASFYVLFGEERGLVVDCGSGSIDTRGMVEKLCPLPYDVVITHAHGDHCGAMCMWDKVWLHPGDFEMAHNMHRLNEQLWENPNIHEGANHAIKLPDGSFWDSPGNNISAKDIYDFDNMKFMGMTLEKLPELQPLEEGQVFDLGGRKVTVVHMPGHTPGGCAFIDDGARIAYTGDAFYQMYGALGQSVTTVLKQALKLKSYQKDYDRIFYGHVSAAGNTSSISMDKSGVDEVIGICKSILDGTVEYTMKKMRNGMEAASVKNDWFRFGFHLDRLIDEGEEPVNF